MRIRITFIFQPATRDPRRLGALFFLHITQRSPKNGCEGDYGASEDVFFWETTFHKLSTVTKIKTFGRFLTELQILE